MPVNSASLSCVMPICFLQYLIFSPMVIFIVLHVSRWLHYNTLEKFFYWHFKILDNSEAATYNGSVKCSDNAIKRKGGCIYGRKQKIYITANELAEMLGVSVGHAYKLILKLNQEL